MNGMVRRPLIILHGRRDHSTSFEPLAALLRSKLHSRPAVIPARQLRECEREYQYGTGEETVRIERRHNMTKEQAKGWIDRKLPDLLAEHFQEEATLRWSGDVLHLSGTSTIGRVSVTGSLSVTNTDLILNLKLPFPFGLVAGGLKDAIQRWLDENLP